MSKVYVIGMIGGSYVASLRADIRGVYTSKEDAISYLKSNKIYPRGDSTWDDLVHERVINPSSTDMYHVKGDIFISNTNSEGFKCSDNYREVLKGWLEGFEEKDKENIVDYTGGKMKADITDFGVESSGYECEYEEEDQVANGCLSIDFYTQELPSLDELCEFVDSKISKYNEENRRRW